jgi:phospholipase C
VRHLRVVAFAGLGAAVLAAAGFGFAAAPRSTIPASIHKIKHVVVIMQENRSFDSYFGTFPGADGIPMRNGVPTVCLPDPHNGGCQRPFHDTADINGGGPHTSHDAVADIDGGKMDGFVAQAERGQSRCANPADPNCHLVGSVDVMGYHTAHEIPNYWAYAHQFVLQDHMFEPTLSWSLPAHLFMVSEWSALCSRPHRARSCTTALDHPALPPDFPANTSGSAPDYAWTDLTYLLYRHHVSWGYYVYPGTQPDCEDDAMTCKQLPQNAKTPGIWNPLPYFDTVRNDRQLGNIRPIHEFYVAARSGTLPAVSWITPAGAVSEHPPAGVTIGEDYVTGLINAIMRGPDWSSTAIFLAWDDWGGFYDHVKPPVVDNAGYGLRVPGLVISAYAKRGYIDHQTLSFDAYAKFIEDDFLGGERINPRTDGRPDRRPDVRENARVLGNLLRDFDFNQRPRKPFILALRPLPPVVVSGFYAAGTVISLKPYALAVHVTATGPTDTDLNGRTIDVSVPPATPVLVHHKPATFAALHTGDGVSLRLVHDIGLATWSATQVASPPLRAPGGG